MASLREKIITGTLLCMSDCSISAILLNSSASTSSGSPFSFTLPWLLSFDGRSNIKPPKSRLVCNRSANKIQNYIKFSF